MVLIVGWSLTRLKFQTLANDVINRLFLERYFSQSWAFDYLQPPILYRYVLTSGQIRNFCDKSEK